MSLVYEYRLWIESGKAPSVRRKKVGGDPISWFIQRLEGLKWESKRSYIAARKTEETIYSCKERGFIG